MTTPVLLAGHGALPSGAADAAQFVVGPQSRLLVCELGPAESPDSYGERLADLVGDAPEVLVRDGDVDELAALAQTAGRGGVLTEPVLTR